MPLVRNRLDPVPSRRGVTVALIAPSGFYRDELGEPREVTTRWSTTVDDDGLWSIDLPDSEAYETELTWYRVDQPGSTHSIVVPPGGPHDLADIVIPDPGDSCTSQAIPARLAALIDVDTTGATVGRVLTVTGTNPLAFGFAAQSGSNSQHVHTQAVGQSVVDITHGLGRRITAIVLRDLTETTFFTDFIWTDLTVDTVRVSMDRPTAFVGVLT